MEILPEQLKNLPNRTMKEWSSLGIKGYVLYMIEFLRISPSYELARRIDVEGLSDKEWQTELFRLYELESKKPLSEQQKQERMTDFKKVITTYETFGDLSTIKFKEWWLERGIYIYGTEHSKPAVRKIDQLSKDEDISDKLISALEKYCAKPREKEGKPPALILSIPLGMNKKALLDQVSKMIDNAKVPLPPKSQKAKKPLTAKRLRSSPLYNGIRLLWFKAGIPEYKLWQLGVKAKISPANQVGLDINAKKPTAKTADQRIRISILTSRSLLKARLIAENAARGDYPSYKKIPLVYFDYQDIYRRMKITRPRKQNNKVI